MSFGLLRQAPASVADRIRLGKVLLSRGRVIDAEFTKSYRPSQVSA